jgi:uncharacterized protein (TIGR03435 family)
MTIQAFWGENWTAVLVNHLWQSTAVTAIAWLLALALRSYQARTRYWVWMIASVKFLVPFSLFITVGEWLRPKDAAHIQGPALAAMMEQITQPFPQTASPVHVSVSTLPATVPHQDNLLPLIVLALYLCGFFVVVFSWIRDWVRIRASVRASSRIMLLAEVPVLSSPRLLEPGIFGVIRPVLVLPEGICDRLSMAHLGTIIAHEICHVRRRDNLTASIHMVVAALFWFHPAVWWIKARLLEERERACDEAVLQSGYDADLYAESILNVCKFYVESPLACVSGVTGSDLKRRIVRIMEEQVARKFNLGTKLLLGLAATALLAMPVFLGLVRINRVSAQSTALSSPHNIVGDWQGVFPDKNRIVFRISKAGEGWRALVYFLDPPGYPTILPSVSFQGDELSFTSSVLNCKYRGKLSADGNSLDGTWTSLNSPPEGVEAAEPVPLPMARATTNTAWPLQPNNTSPIMASTLDPSFEVTTVKPHDPNVPDGGWQWRGARRFQATMPVSGMIQYVYGINKNQVINAPGWAFKDVYDYAGVPNMPGLPTEQQRINMMRKLLEERFNLKVHTEKRELASFVLSPAKGGSKLISSVLVNEPGCTISMRMGTTGGLVLQARNTAMGDFIRFLHSIQDRPVLDQTGLTGQFDFDLSFMPDDSMFGGDMRLPPSDNPPPDLFTAMQEQLGLKLTPGKEPVDVIVIDRLERPSPN